MKLIVKSKFFDEIVEGKKKIDFRANHITFVNDETGEEFVVRNVNVFRLEQSDLPSFTDGAKLTEEEKKEMFGDESLIGFSWV